MTERPRPVELTDELKQQLTSVSTATITSQLQRRGFQNCFLAGLHPLHYDQRMVGYAHTLRYVPHRPDMGELIGFNAQRAAVESMDTDEVLVIDARGVPDAGTIGDIYSLRSQQLGAVGVVTDGALRDTPAIRDLGMAVYYQSSHAAILSRRHSPVAHQVPIACAGVAVMPGDIVVGDAEGAVVIPASLVVEVAADSVAMEEREEFAIEKVGDGASIEGYFPLGDDNREEFESWRAARSGGQG